MSGETIRPALTWRPIPGYEGFYDASNAGDVRRIARLDSLGRPRRTGILRQTLDRGYCRVSLSRDDVAKSFPVHRLVAVAFHGPAPEGFSVNHIDGVKTNNRPENLEYVTSAENTAHAVRHGLRAVGERHGSAVIGPEIVRKMRRLYESGQDSRQIARLYGLHPDHVLKIATRKAWKHVA